MKLHNSGDPKENARLFAGFVLLVILAYAGFVFKPAQAELASLRLGYDRLVQEVGVGRAKAKELVGFAREVATLRKQVTGIEGRLRAERAMPFVLRDAQRIALASRVKLQSITPGGFTAKGGYAEQAVSFKLQANPAGLSAFIRELESLPYVVRVTSAEVNTGSLTSGDELEVSLGAVMYTLGKGGEATNEAGEPAGALPGRGADGGTTGR